MKCAVGIGEEAKAEESLQMGLNRKGDGRGDLIQAIRWSDVTRYGRLISISNTQPCSRRRIEFRPSPPHLTPHESSNRFHASQQPTNNLTTVNNVT